LAQTDRRLAAIMLADIAGYSALMERNEKRTFDRLRLLREQTISPKVAKFGGRIIKTTGDGFLAEFPSATAALGCGITIQRTNFTQEAMKDEAERFHLRIGINVGDIFSDGDDISGDGVNVAARLEPLAPIDGICVSGAVRDQVREDLGVILEDLGEQQVKNISRPIRAYRINLTNVPLAKPARPRPHRRPWVVLGGAFALLIALAVSGVAIWHAFSSPSAPPFSLVVLPFQSISHDPDQQAFADGLTSDLTNVLGHISGSFVISSGTALTYKGKPVDVRQIGRELAVRYVLEGSVRKLDDDVTVDAQLINAETGAEIWSDQFNGNFTRLADLHDDVKHRVARSLDFTILTEEGRRSQKEADNRDAVALTFQGRGIVMRGLSPAGIAESRKLFDQALQASPDYAAALVFRSMVDLQDVSFFRANIPLDAVEQRLNRALELEPSDLMANMTAAWLYLQKGDLDRSSSFAERTIAIDPNHPNAYALLNDVRKGQGRAQEAIPLLEKAIRLSPREPFIDAWYRELGSAYLLLGKDQEAVSWLEKAVATNDKVWTYHAALASAYALTGHSDAAHKELDAVNRLSPGATIGKYLAGYLRLSSNEIFLKQVDHIASGLRLLSMPEN
jgi:adenylate cyclase